MQAKVLCDQSRARIFSPFMEVETWGDLWSVQDFAHA